MNKTFITLVFMILLSIYLPANTPVTEGLMPQEVPTAAIQTLPFGADAKADKSVLRPGETVKITLLNFRYEVQKDITRPFRETVIVRSSAGLIMDGTTVVFNEDVFGGGQAGTGSVKAFLLDSSRESIEVYYRAPLRGKQSEVKIEVFNFPRNDIDATQYPSYETPKDWETNSEGVLMVEKGALIAKAMLKIQWGTYFLLNYEENKRSKRGTILEYTHKIKSVIRIDCEPWVAGNMLQVKNLQVLEFNGRADLIGSNYHEVQEAVSAEPFAYNSLVLLNLDPENQAIRGIIYEPVPLTVAWQGDEIPEGPPDVVNVGPVSKYKKNPWDARWQGGLLEEEFPGEGKDAKRARRMQQFALQNFSATQVHPDHLVKEGDGKTLFAGRGEWEKSSGSNSHHKTYTWELYITDK